MQETEGAYSAAGLREHRADKSPPGKVQPVCYLGNSSQFVALAIAAHVIAFHCLLLPFCSAPNNVLADCYYEHCDSIAFHCLLLPWWWHSTVHCCLGNGIPLSIVALVMAIHCPSPWWWHMFHWPWDSIPLLSIVALVMAFYCPSLPWWWHSIVHVALVMAFRCPCCLGDICSPSVTTLVLYTLPRQDTMSNEVATQVSVLREKLSRMKVCTLYNELCTLDQFFPH